MSPKRASEKARQVHEALRSYQLHTVSLENLETSGSKSKEPPFEWPRVKACGPKGYKEEVFADTTALCEVQTCTLAQGSDM